MLSASQLWSNHSRQTDKLSIDLIFTLHGQWNRCFKSKRRGSNWEQGLAEWKASWNLSFSRRKSSSTGKSINSVFKARAFDANG